MEINPIYWVYHFYLLPFLIVYHQLRMYGRKSVSIKTSLYIYIYIYIERERERAYKCVWIYTRKIVNNRKISFKLDEGKKIDPKLDSSMFELHISI